MLLHCGLHFEWQVFRRFHPRDISHGTLLGSHLEILRDSVSLFGYIVMKLLWYRGSEALDTSSLA